MRDGRSEVAWKRDRIVEELRELNLRAGDTVIAHASIRAVGEVEGGADTVLDALLEILGPEGTLMAPAFNRGNRALESLAAAEIRYRAASDSGHNESQFIKGVSRGQVGIFAERLHARPEAKRGDHPTLSFSAIGRSAAFLIDRAPFHSPLGTNSPLARLHQLNGSILLIGVGHAANSTLHLAEHWADAPYARRKATVRMPDSSIREMDGSPECSAGFAKIEPILRQARITRSGFVGNAPAQLMRAQFVVSMAMEMLRGNPESLLCDDPACAACAHGRKLASPMDSRPIGGRYEPG